jgi:hypothetical protein
MDGVDGAGSWERMVCHGSIIYARMCHRQFTGNILGLGPAGSRPLPCWAMGAASWAALVFNRFQADPSWPGQPRRDHRAAGYPALPARIGTLPRAPHPSGFPW